ncbi:MAG: hypothetical protein ACYTG0_20400, partial [Planctomycetota bacterium]
MAAKDSRSGKKAGWRGESKPAAPSGRARAQEGGRWKQKKDRQHERAKTRHRLKLAAGLLLAGGLIAGYVMYVIYSPVTTPLLALAVIDYQAPVGPNAWAETDVERLKSLAPEIVSSVEWKSVGSNWDPLREALENHTRPGGPEKNLVIVYLSMHGAVNGQGQPCLLPRDTNPEEPVGLDSSRWLPVRGLLETLGSWRKDVNKLLILDSNRMDVNWSMGLLYNDFARQLEVLVGELKIPNLYVLNSAGREQIGHAAPELGGSVFGHYLWQGLKGAADSDGNQDDTVSLDELSEYLNDRVGRWVAVNRSDRQQPMLLRPHNGSESSDVPLVYASGEESPAERTPIASGGQWNDVAEYWRLHQRLRNRHRVDRNGQRVLVETAVYSRHPSAWAEFEHKLLRWEQLLLAGGANLYKQEIHEIEIRLERLRQTLSKEPFPDDDAGDDPAAYSLPLARRLRGNWGTDEERQKIHDYLRGTTGVSNPKTGPEASATESGGEAKPPAESPESEDDGQGSKAPKESSEAGADAAKPKAKPKAPPKKEAKPELPPSYTYLAAAAESWQWLLPNPSPEKLAKAFEVLSGAAGNRGADVVEIHFLRMLDAYLDRDTGRIDLPRALAARHLAEIAAAPVDERSHYWVRQTVDEADDRRRRAEDWLFIGDDDSRSEAVGHWALVAGDDLAGGEYGHAIQTATEIAEAFALRDQACAEIPYLAEWLLARQRRPRPTESDTQDLHQLIHDTHQLARHLDGFSNLGAWRTPQRNTKDAVEARLSDLNDRFDNECQYLIDEAGGGKDALRDLAAVLAVPLLSGEDRATLRGMFLRIANAEAGGASASRPAGESETPAESDTQAAKPTPWHHSFVDWDPSLKQWSPHPAWAILGQADSTTPPSAARGPADPAVSPEHPELVDDELFGMLAEQGEKVRRRLREEILADANRLVADSTQKLVEKGSSLESPGAGRRGLSEADRLVRASAAVAGREFWGPKADPTHRLRRFDLHALMLWHCRRTLDDFWGPRQRREEPHFQIAAGHYLASAEGLCSQASAFWDGQVDFRKRLRDRTAATVQLEVKEELYLIEEEKEPQRAEDKLLLDHNASVTFAGDLPEGEAAFYLHDPDGTPVEVVKPKTKQRLQRTDVSVPAGSAGPMRYLIQNDSRLEGRCEAFVLYRGHLRRMPFKGVPDNPLVVEFEPPPYQKPTVTVKGELHRPAYVMFILDCSGSMGEAVQSDIPGAPSDRLSEAKEQLGAILRELSLAERPYYVGLRVYGHRV